MLQVPECLLNPLLKRRHPIHTGSSGGSRSMTGIVQECPEESPQETEVKKIKTLMPVKDQENGKDKSDSESDSEEETRVINDIDYEALEDIWLKAGEIEAKDMTYNEKKRRKKECGKCKGCKRDEDCGSCRDCQENRLGSICLTRRCRGKRRSKAEDKEAASTETDTTDEEWKDERDESPERRKFSNSPEKKRKATKSPKPSAKLSVSDTNGDHEYDDDDDIPAAAVVTKPWKPVEYMYPLAGKQLAAPPPATPPKLGAAPAAGFASAFLNFLSPGAPPLPSAPEPAKTPAPVTNPMIRVDYEKHEQIESPVKNDLKPNPQSLTSTIEKLKTSLNNTNNSNSKAPSTISSQDKPISTTSTIATTVLSTTSLSTSEITVIQDENKSKTLVERNLELLMKYGVTPQQVTILQRGNSNFAVEKLISKAAQMNQLQSQMSPTHKETLTYSKQQQTHRAAALAVLALLPKHQLINLERQLLDLTKWTGELKQVGIRWELAVKPPPGQGLRKCFIIEKRQLRELEIDTNNCKIYKSVK